MSGGKAIVAIGILAFAAGAQPQEMSAKLPPVRNCRDVVMTRPGMGPAYSGTVENSDYDFSARLPSGLTAWGGVAESAPFHGFTIFLGPKVESCIVFEVHIRVDESDRFAPLPGAKSVPLGKAQGWQTTNTGLAGGVRLTNVQTVFSFRQPDEMDDGSILLITPDSSAGEALKTYRLFLRNLVFGH
jgi:hypothetical protein